MNVMMIGHAGSGKTTYMAAMYGLMVNGIEKYSIISTTQKGHDNLYAIINTILKGAYPGATDIHAEYNFYLQYDEEPLIDFDWYDYRGGALFERTNSSAETARLIERIRNADALIVFLDGDKVNLKDNSLLREYRRIAQFIEQAISKIDQETPFPISFLITKAGKHPNQNLYDSHGVREMMPLFEKISNSKNVHGLLAITEVSKDSLYNIEYPFLFSMMFGIERLRSKIADMHENHRQKAVSFSNSSSLLDDGVGAIYNFFGEKYTTLSSLAKKERAEMEKLEETHGILSAHLQNIHAIVKKAGEESINLF